MNQKRLAILILALIIMILVGAVAYLFLVKKPSSIGPPSNELEISWEECTKLAGSVILQSYPEQCVTSDGRKAVKPTPTSTAKPIVSIELHSDRSPPVLGGKPSIEVVVWASNGFPVRNEIAVLRIDSKEFMLSRYPESGDTQTLIFTLTPEEFAQTATGDLVTVQYGRGGESNEQWNFGTLDKGLLVNKR